MIAALTFDDVLLIPAYSELLPRDACLHTKFSRNIKLHIPFISAAMDTVTESKMAIAMAQAGGLGIIHKNLSVMQQANEVLRVKRYESGVLRDPITVTPDLRISDVKDLAKQHGISGFPVLDGQKVIGVITNRDMHFEQELNSKVSEKMTKQDRLITVFDGPNSLDQAKKLMHQHRLERVLVIDHDFNLQGLITAKDIEKAINYPEASKDRQGQLQVGAAVGVGLDSDERIEALINAGVDAIVVDTAHGHSYGVLEKIKWIKRNYQVEVIGGNIATAQAAKSLLESGADGVKVGIGPGSICTTRIIAGVGVPQITAICDVSKALKGSDISVIADGGIRYSGDAAKALAVGAHTIMMGGIFAGTEEAPGEIFLYQGRSFKSYRGMGSVGAMKDGAADRYFQENNISNIDKLVPEGIEGRVPYKGAVGPILHQLTGGLRASMGYCGCTTIYDWHERAQFIQITAAGMRESHVHDVQITKEAPNYHQD